MNEMKQTPRILTEKEKRNWILQNTGGIVDCKKAEAEEKDVGLFSKSS